MAGGTVGQESGRYPSFATSSAGQNPGESDFDLIRERALQEAAADVRRELQRREAFRPATLGDKLLVLSTLVAFVGFLGSITILVLGLIT